MNLPQPFLDRIATQFGSDTDAIVTAMKQPAAVSVRLNTLKIRSEKDEQDLSLKPVPWASHGYYLPERPLFTCDPLLHAGCYYVQEPSSMLVEEAIRWIRERDNPGTVLDLSAAPGGKTTHLMSLLKDETLIVANEVIRSRSWILAENVTKWSGANTAVTNNDPADFAALGEFFDVMLVDAPCSGEGLFRKDDEAIHQWSPENLQLCEKRQQRILNDALPALKCGGYLIYCTCTFNPAENEEIVRSLIDRERYQLVDLQLDPTWGFSEIDFEPGVAYQALPHKLSGEGFFLAVLQKTRPSEQVPQPKSQSNKRKPRRSKRNRCQPCDEEATPEAARVFEPVTRRTGDSFRNWLSNPQRYRLLNRGEQVVAFPRDLVEDILKIQEQLKVVGFGVPVADLKKHGPIPAHGLALSLAFHRDAFPSTEVDWQTALRYLRREPIETTLPDGVGYITYRDHPLGWVKQVGPRSNNWYPQEWRIRMPIPNDKPWSLIG